MIIKQLEQATHSLKSKNSFLKQETGYLANFRSSGPELFC